jgi:hypothetical protein
VMRLSSAKTQFERKSDEVSGLMQGAIRVSFGFQPQLLVMSIAGAADCEGRRHGCHL